MSDPSDASSSKNEDKDRHDLETPAKRRKSMSGTFHVDSTETSNEKDNEKGNERKSKTIEQENSVESAEELGSEIAQMKRHIEKYEKFQSEKSELKRLIAEWSRGGREALRMLQDEIQSEQNVEDILTHLHLPSDVFDHATVE